ncbi:hypothetical protein ABZS81_18690 [Streptomyces sp. NPDC005318]|uniref:hypothetical protein n=1 Tax=Streptomyces sp. NPDC005318 TaxID=3157031 RepID=UPI0033A89CEE
MASNLGFQIAPSRDQPKLDQQEMALTWHIVVSMNFRAREYFATIAETVDSRQGQINTVRR